MYGYGYGYGQKKNWVKNISKRVKEGQGRKKKEKGKKKDRWRGGCMYG